MPEPISTAAIARVISRIVDELLELGRDLFSAQLAKLQREGVQRKLVRRASSVEMVKTIWQLERPVRISDFYYPSQIRFNPEVTKEVTSLKHFPRRGNFVIQGTIGQGKSIFLRYLCAQELRGKGTDRIPIFVELRSVNAEHGVQGAILGILDEYGFDVSEDLWNFYSISGKFVLLLDAFDELLPECVSGVLAELDRMSSKYPDLQIIVTSRPDSDIQHNRNFRTFRLAPLQTSDHKPFLKKLMANDDDAKKLLSAIASSPARVASLLTTPLMLTLVAIVYRADKEIPIDLPAFFERLFSTLFSRHDRTKDGFIRKRNSSLSERDTQIVFEAFCFMTRYHGMSTSITIQEFSKSLRDAITYSGIPADPDAFFQDITKVACLMQKEGEKLNFIHKSIQEFFAASFVRNASGEFALRYYTLQQKQTPIWRQENLFLSQIDPYRFGKNFFIPQILSVERFCGIKFSDGTPRADARIVELLARNSTIQVTKYEDLYDPSVFTDPPPDAGPMIRNLISRIMWPCYTNLSGMEKDYDTTYLKSLRQVEDGRFEGHVFTFLEKSGLIQEAIDELDEEFDSLKSRYDQVWRTIEIEESKSELFSDLKGPITPTRPS